MQLTYRDIFALCVLLISGTLFLLPGQAFQGIDSFTFADLVVHAIIWISITVSSAWAGWPSSLGWRKLLWQSLLLFAVGFELAQAFVPNRTVTWEDGLVNVIVCGLCQLYFQTLRSNP